MSVSYLLTGRACIKLGTSIKVEGGLEGVPWWLWWSIIPSGVSLGLLSPYSISLDVENSLTNLDVDCGWGSRHGVRWPAISINDLKPVSKASKETQHYGITAWMEEGVDNSNHHSPNPRQITVLSVRNPIECNSTALYSVGHSPYHIINSWYYSILILKGSRDLSDKKLWNKFLVARANGITQYYLW